MAKTPKRAEKAASLSKKAKDAPEPQDLDPAQEALFREVEEDLRAEQMQKLWKQYGSYVIGAAVLIVAIVAGFQGWSTWQASVRADEAGRYFTAIDATGSDATVDDDALIALGKEGQTGYAEMARIRHANDLAAAGDTAGAIVAYDALSSDGGAPKPVRDLAAMLAALNAMDLEDPATVRGRLTPLAADDGAWRFMARELIATLDMRAGNADAARDMFTALTEERDAPPGVRTRASEYLSMLGGPATNVDADGGEG
ncbi:tetratricopeptide repeat protein [Roseospira marina]|uniref:Tetratricopeptide repeat protein n=1 Tax=Roseospira marina TaxID=140057 RepID=A0A5M6II32_9PROT|nr:tetratricopeptide repeat protein [Roseospira marina]KAA5607315.1 tetratricopeptide repeat protein [Roseospira marina]MBB4312525.1 hypothetical protein [Roseospira marina]MBB5085459.1 hypothetical protein [Roseospira marina]